MVDFNNMQASLTKFQTKLPVKQTFLEINNSLIFTGITT